jgi:hypothetical protein
MRLREGTSVVAGDREPQVDGILVGFKTHGVLDLDIGMTSQPVGDRPEQVGHSEPRDQTFVLLVQVRMLSGDWVAMPFERVSYFVEEEMPAFSEQSDYQLEGAVKSLSDGGVVNSLIRSFPSPAPQPYRHHLSAVA